MPFFRIVTYYSHLIFSLSPFASAWLKFPSHFILLASCVKTWNGLYKRTRQNISQEKIQWSFFYLLWQLQNSTHNIYLEGYFFVTTPRIIRHTIQGIPLRINSLKNRWIQPPKYFSAFLHIKKKKRLQHTTTFSYGKIL